MDFALMYIPSESVYYEVVNQTDVIDYARRARVYMVSPSTLYAHLQTILLSFEGKKIESKSKELFTLLRSMQIDYKKIDENMSTLGKHINNAYSQFGNVLSGFSSLGQKLNSSNNLESKQKEIAQKEKMIQ
jgi:DNA recombination protein RmuC